MLNRHSLSPFHLDSGCEFRISNSVTVPSDQTERGSLMCSETATAAPRVAVAQVSKVLTKPGREKEKGKERERGREVGRWVRAAAWLCEVRWDQPT